MSFIFTGGDYSFPLRDLGHQAAELPVEYKAGKHGHSRTGDCGCGWSPELYGDVCPEHGQPATLQPQDTSFAATDGLPIMDAVAQVLADRHDMSLDDVRDQLRAMGDIQHLYEFDIAPAIDSISTRFWCTKGAKK